MDWNDLKVALAIARTGSMTQAAQLLGVNQSTVGRRLTELEAALGTTLFRRSKQGLAPTEAGEVMVAKAAEIEARTEQIAEAIAGTGREPAGTVRLAANQWTIDRLVAHGLGDLLERHPRLTIRTLAGRPQASLWRGDPGMGLWFEQRPLDGAFAIKLGMVPYAVYRAFGAEPAAWVAFFDENAPTSRVGQHVESLRHRAEPIRMTALDAGTLRDAVAAGIGKGLLPVCVGDADPRLIRVPDAAILERAMHLHVHPDTLGTPRVQVLLAWLRGCFDTVFGAG